MKIATLFVRVCVRYVITAVSFSRSRSCFYYFSHFGSYLKEHFNLIIIAATVSRIVFFKSGTFTTQPFDYIGRVGILPKLCTHTHKHLWLQCAFSKSNQSKFQECRIAVFISSSSMCVGYIKRTPNISKYNYGSIRHRQKVISMHDIEE